MSDTWEGCSARIVAAYVRDNVLDWRLPSTYQFNCKERLMKYLFALSAVLSFAALLSMPIGYYTILRIAITVACLIAIYDDRDKGVSPWNIVFGAIAIVFNPVIPVHFNNREIWSVIDTATGIVFALRFILSLRR